MHSIRASQLVMKSLLLLIIAISCASASEAEEGRLPRGVSPSVASLYKERAEFECLDGSKRIPWDHLNDDYCDCKDGSDEPGTSACSNGHFYCPNAGYKGTKVPSSRVNDFICDCCDGSDEWNTAVECPNVCATLGEKSRAQEAQLRSTQAAGYAKRQELAKEGSKLLEERKTELEKQKKELEELEPLKTSLTEAKDAAEQKEREAKQGYDEKWNALKADHQKKRVNELFAKWDTNADEKLAIDEITQALEHRNEEGTVVFNPEEDIKTIYGESTELDITSFGEAYEKVKDVVKRLTKAKQPPAPPREKSAGPAPESPSNEEEEDDDVSKEHHDEEEDDHDERDEPVRPPYDDSTKQIIEEADAAREKHKEILQKVSDLENGIRTAEDFLQFQYGPDHAWAPLKGQCAELTTNQYTYKLCLFDRSVQKDRNGHSEISLGHWSGWVGPDSNLFSSQKYEKGQSCWNGPERSTLVDIQCGQELQLLEVQEPSKCEYSFVVSSPAGCSNPEEVKLHEHPEL